MRWITIIRRLSRNIDISIWSITKSIWSNIKVTTIQNGAISVLGIQIFGMCTKADMISSN